jgi:hypothetical protein
MLMISAAAQLEGDVVEGARLAQSLDRYGNLADIAPLSIGGHAALLLVDLLQGPGVGADHQFVEPMFGRTERVQRRHLAGVFERGDPVGDLQHVLQEVRDEDDRLDLLLECGDQLVLLRIWGF